jgi:DNA polymerase IV
MKPLWIWAAPHGSSLSPAPSLARFAARVAIDTGITVSIGLSTNKFLAKIASDLHKRRGFAVLGGNAAQRSLAPKPVSFIWCMGAVMQARLTRDGITLIGDLAATTETELKHRYGAEGVHRSRLAPSLDARAVKRPNARPRARRRRPTIARRRLWLLCEKLSGRRKAADLAASRSGLRWRISSCERRGAHLRIQPKSQPRFSRLAASS